MALKVTLNLRNGNKHFHTHLLVQPAFLAQLTAVTFSPFGPFNLPWHERDVPTTISNQAACWGSLGCEISTVQIIIS